MSQIDPHPPIICLDDDLIGQAAIGRRYGVSPASVSRHMTQGVSIAGLRLKLPSIRIAGRRFTTEAALQWWFTTQQRLDQSTRDEFTPATADDVATDGAKATDSIVEDALVRLAESEGL